MSPPQASRTDSNNDNDNDDYNAETIPVSIVSNDCGSADDKENDAMHYRSSSISMDEQLLQIQQQQRREDRGEEEYERAVRRALAENEYVKQINSQLLDKLTTVMHENEASKKSIHKLTNVCQSMKELIIELDKAKDSSEAKVRELEKATSRQKDGKIVTLAKLEALEIGQRSMDEMVTALRGSLDVASRERDEANAKVVELTLAVEEAKKNAQEENEVNPPSTRDCKLEEKLALATEGIESLAQKYQGSSQKLIEVTDERNALKIKCDEMQSMITLSKMDVDAWQTKYDELAEQFAQVTSERNSLSETLDKRCGDWETKYGELSEQLNRVTSERNTLSDALDSKSEEWETKCKELTEEMKQMTSEWDSRSMALEKTCEDWETKCVGMTEQLNQITSERNTISEALDSKSEECETKCKELTEEMKKMTLEWDSRNMALEKRCRDWETKCGEMTEQLNQVTSERNTLRDALNSKCAEDWETKCGELTEQMKQMTLEWKSLSEALDNKCGEWETKCGEMTEQLKLVTSERNALDESLHDKMQTFLAEKKELEETIDLLARDSDEWQDKYNKSNIELVKITAAYDGLQVTLHETQESMNEVKRISEEISVEKSALQKEMVCLSRQVQEQSVEKKSLQLEINSLQSKIAGIDSARDVEVSNLRREFESAKVSLVGASREFDNLATENGSLRQDIDLLKKERDELQSKCYESANDLVKMTATRETLDSELQRVRATIIDSKQMFEDEKALLQKKIEDLTNKANELSKVNIALGQEVDSLKFKVEEITAAKELEVGNLRLERESSNATLNEATSSRGSLAAEVGSLRQEIAFFAKDNIHWQDKYIKCAKDLVELTSKCAGLETKLQGARITGDDSNEACEELSTKNATMLTEINDLTKKIDDHSAMNSTLQQEIDYLQYKLEAMKLTKEREVENLQQELKSASSLLIGSSSELEHMMAENRSLRQQIRTLKADLTSSSQITLRLESADAKNESLANEVSCLKKENGTLQHQVQNLQCYLSEITACHDNSIEVISPTHLQQAEKEYFSSELDDLAAKIDALQQKNDGLQDKLSEITDAKESAAQSFQNTIDGLSEQLAERGEMAKILEQQLKDVENDLNLEKEELKLKVTSLEADLNKSKQEQDRLQRAMELLEVSRAESLTRMEHDKTDYEEQIRSMSLTVDSVTSKIKSLETDILQSKQQEEMLRDALAISEFNHAEALAKLEGEKAEIQGQMNSMSVAFDSEKEGAVQRQEQLRSKISSLEADILRAKHDEDVLRKETELLDAKNAELSAQIVQEKLDLQNTLKDLKLVHDDEMKNVSQEQSRLKSKVETIEAELIRSKEKEDKLRDAMALLENRHEEDLTCLEDERAGSQDKVKSLTLALDAAKEEADVLKSKIVSLEEDLLRSTDEGKNVRTTMELLESSHAANVANLLSRLEEMNNHEIAQRQRMNLQIEELTASVESASIKLADANANCENQKAHLTKCLEEKTLIVNNLEDEMRAMSNSIGALSAEVAAADEKILILQSELDGAKNDAYRDQENLSTRIVSLEADLHQSTQAELSIRTAMKSLEIRHADMRARFEDEINEVQARFATLTEKSTAEKKNLIEKVRALEAKTDIFFEEGKVQQGEMNKLIQKLDSTQRELDARTTENTALTNKCRTLETEVQKSLDQIEQLTSSFNKAQKTLASMKEQNESLYNELSDVKRERDQAMSKIEGLSDELKVTAISLSEVQILISKDQVLSAETQKQLRTLEAEKNQLEESIIAIRSERGEFIQQLECSRQETEDFRKKFESSQSALELLAHRFQLAESEIEASKQVVVDLSDKLESSESLARTLEEQCDLLKSTVSDLTTKSNDANATKKVLQQELSEVQESMRKDQVQAAETQQMLRNLEAQKMQLEESIISARNDRDDINQQLQFSRQQVEDFRFKLESSQSALESMTNRCEIVESEIEASKQLVIELNDKLESSELLAKTMEGTSNELKSTIAELTTKSNDADTLVKVLQSENHRNIARCKQQEERSKSEIVCLENIINSLKTEYHSFKVEAEAAATAQLRSCEAKLDSLCAVDEHNVARLQDRSFDDRIAMLRKDRIQLLEKSRSAAQQLEVSQKKISALEHDVALMKKEFEAFRAEANAAAKAQMKSFMADLEPLCSFRKDCVSELQPQTLEEMIIIIKDDISRTIKELELAQDEKLVLDEQVCILSTEVSKFKLQNKGLLKALNDITMNM